MFKKVKRKCVEIRGKQEEVEGKKKTRGMIERAKKNSHQQCNIAGSHSKVTKNQAFLYVKPRQLVVASIFRIK